jgi:hypothetical protein
MSEQQSRVTWTTRINLRPQASDQIKAMATADRISVATMIGIAVETYVTARSTS